MLTFPLTLLVSWFTFQYLPLLHIACWIADFAPEDVGRLRLPCICILLLSLQLHVAISASVLSALASSCFAPHILLGLWVLVLGVLGDHRPSGVDTLGRWTVARLPW